MCIQNTDETRSEKDRTVRAAFWRLEKEKQDPDAARWRSAYKLL